MLHEGDCLPWLRTLPSDSVDACVTDPPYGLSFMGKAWDHGLPNAAVWAEVLRVLKPGSHICAFGGTRTFHRLACHIEDAGFEMRDTIMWLYGTGFPKSHDVSKGIDREAGAARPVVGANPNHRAVSGVGYEGVYAGGNTGSSVITAPATSEAAAWQGWGTALKPAWEPIILARKTLAGTVAANVLAHGTGALNIDGCRVPLDGEVNPSVGRRQGAINHLSDRPARETEAEGRMASRQSPDAYRAERAGEALGRWPANVVHDGSDEVEAAFPGTEHRFFYSAKASAADRAGSKHPTVKPVALMRWLVRLVTPPGGVVLDPFAGSGTTLQAAHMEGASWLAADMVPEYQQDVWRRMLPLMLR